MQILVELITCYCHDISYYVCSIKDELKTTPTTRFVVDSLGKLKLNGLDNKREFE